VTRPSPNTGFPLVGRFPPDQEKKKSVESPVNENRMTPLFRPRQVGLVVSGGNRMLDCARTLPTHTKMKTRGMKMRRNNFIDLEVLVENVFKIKWVSKG
jgi:hypothetical protein